MSRQLSVKSYRKYSDKTLSHAVEMISRKSMSLRQASIAFNIPKSTLSNKMNGKSQVGCRSGPPTVLSREEEDQLAQWAVNMAQMGFGRTRNELLDTVQLLIKEDKRSTPFVNDRPGKDWYYAFLKRHPELSARTPQQLAKERAVITPSRVENWFPDFSEFMCKESNDQTLWKDPTRWFNADESGFPLCPKSEKVLAPRGVPNIYNFTSSDKTQITVLACMNAAGLFLHPLIVFAGQRFTYNPLEDFPDAVLGRTKNGWMDSELFVTWLKDVFLPAIEENCIKRPVVLFVDGHSTHSTFEASKFCRENQIILYCLLEHGSHLMQPCDISLFSTLKSTWKQSVRKFQIENVGEFVTRSKFSKVFKAAWEMACTTDVSVKGFKESGLFPLNPSKVTNTLKMEPSKIFAHVSENVEPTSAVSTVPESHQNTSACEVPSTVADPLQQPACEVQSTVSESFQDTTCELSSTTSATIGIPLQSDAIAITAITPSVSLENNSIHTKTAESISDTVSPVLNKILKLPIAVKATKKSAKRRVVLPKAISGKQFHDILQKRQQQKEEELARKETRRKEREEKRIKSKEEKERKAKEREEKRNVMEQKKREKELEKKVKVFERIESQKHKSQDSDSSDSDVSLEFADDEMEDFNTDIRQACYACDMPYDNNTCDWVICQKWDRWIHRACVKTIDLLSMSEVEIADMGFECDYC